MRVISVVCGSKFTNYHENVIVGDRDPLLFQMVFRLSVAFIITEIFVLMCRRKIDKMTYRQF